MGTLVAQWDPRAVTAPPIDDLLDFIGEKGAFKESSTFQCHPFNFWASLYADNPISSLGRFLAAVPAIRVAHAYLGLFFEAVGDDS